MKRVNLGDTVRLANRKEEGPVIGTMTIQAPPAAGATGDWESTLRRSVCVMWATGPDWHRADEVVLVAKAAKP